LTGKHTLFGKITGTTIFSEWHHSRRR
jgi:hypothetical protein